MALGCGPKIAKFILFVFNVLFWLSGLILIIVGAVYLSNGTMKYIDDIVNMSTNRNILIGFVVIGVIIFVIGFCGCCGAVKESRLLLAIYIILLLVIIVAEVAFGIYAILNRNPVEEAINKKLKHAFEKLYGTSDLTVNQAVDGLQQVAKCCGVNSPDDWQQSNWYINVTEKAQIVPKSCCSPMDSPCWLPTNNGTKFHTGCMPMMKQYASKYFPIVIGVALGIALFEILVVICAFCLCRNTDSQSQAV